MCDMNICPYLVLQILLFIPLRSLYLVSFLPVPKPSLYDFLIFII